MDFLKMLKCCLNYKVIVGVAAVIAGIYFFAPQLTQYSWILLVLICPLSMILMMGMMNRGSTDGKERLYACPECRMDYTDAEWAKKCATWCKEHKSCNLDIIQHAVQKNN